MKESGWIRHDNDARNDIKIQRIVRKYGGVAKAIYWDILEMLSQKGGFLPFSVEDDLAFINYIDDISVIDSIIKDSGLFEFDDDKFWSIRMLRELEVKDKLIEDKRSAGRKGGLSRHKQNQADAKQNQADAKQNQADAKQNQADSSTIHNITKHNNNNYVSFNKDTYSPSPKDEPVKEAAEELFNNRDKEIIISEDNAADSSSKPPKKVNYDAVKDFWNDKMSHIPEIPKVARLTDVRKAKIEVRFKEFTEVGENPWSVYGIILDKIVNSKFARGDNDRGWRIDFGWIFENERNWVKVYEGRYDDRKPSSNPFTGVPTRTSLRNDANSEWE